ncbi:hypothetical protein GCM10027062_03370 [Nocardioides hungaricus]
MVVGKALGALVAVVLALGLMAPGSADPARKDATLRMTVNGGYDAYVGGQGLTLTGQLPTTGVRRIWLERHMNRPGDDWTKVEDLPYRGQTNADGSFTMQIRAPDMVGLSYRVRGAQGGGVTPGVTFEPKTQDVTMQVLNPLNLGALVVVADTTPDLYRRPDTQGLPVFAGRDLTLQRRVSPTGWETISTTQVGLDGRGVFLPFLESRGEQVYRVRMEDWTRDGSDVGWQASFPTYVEVGSLLGLLRSGRPSPAPAPVDRAPAARAVEVTGTAAQKYQWYPVRWGFDWEEGQDLDSPPKNGVRKGRWIQYTDGAGRAGKHNGGIRLDSGRLVPSGSGDFGTTRATLTGNADAYGRWETRLRMKTFETRSRDMDIVVELVPERASDYQCGRRNITIARYTGAGSQLTFGVNAMNTRWTRTISAPSLSGNIPAFAVEVAKSHIAWFVNGTPVGVVTGKAAVSDVPMTMRFSLVGEKGTEYKNTSIYSDWQRSFGIDAGTQVKDGPRLTKSALDGCVD